MRTLYIECNMGAAGDMLAGALLELVPDRTSALAKLNSLGIPGVEISGEQMVKQGVVGTHFKVTVNGEEEHSHDIHDNDHHRHDDHHEHHEHHEHGHAHSHEEHGHQPHSHEHRDPGEVQELLTSLTVPAEALRDAQEIYRILADAEASAHGVPVDQVHFHEVGAMDAVADIVSVCYLLDILKPDEIIVSPVTTGFGQVRCAHGIVPVPAPAAAKLLLGIPTVSGNIAGELCTPTGAAILRHYADSFGRMPVMRVEKIGYGMGMKDFPAANCVRAFLGETDGQGDTILELQCNLDDMTPEALGFAQERLMAAGALDVYTTGIGMKKNRPGILLTCLCRPDQRENMLSLLFRHTTTLGVREHRWGRTVLSRRERVEETVAGAIRIKTAEGWGVRREKPEYDDLSAIAREKGISLAEAADYLKKE